MTPFQARIQDFGPDLDEEFGGPVDVEHVIFRSEEDGYAVLAVTDPESGDEFTAIGPLGHLEAGERVELHGEWSHHARYGPQLKATAALPLDPVDRAGQVAYLTTLRHIGPARAERLCDRHGEEVLEVIAANPYSVFSALKGLSSAQANAAAESWTKTRAVRNLHVHLAPHGLAHLAAAINARYGDQALTILHEDPYRLTEIDGVGFARADSIALAGDVPPTSNRRAEAATVHVLSEAEREGHTHLPLDELRRRAAKLLGAVPDPDVLAGAPGVLLDEGGVYREGTHRCELRVAATLGARATAEPIIEHEPGDDPTGGLTDEQWAAVRGAFASRISVLTGGPGVGKTVCIQAIVEQAQMADVRIALCAPTGRAARRMQEATGHPAQTIHRLVEWIPGKQPRHRPGHPLPAGLLVVDEASMLNLRLAEVLLDATAESTHIVWVGDADQLPPIGAGKPFADLIAADVSPVVRLTQIFRQAARSMITTAAHAINSGQAPALDPVPGQEHDLFAIDRPNPERALDAVEELVAERIPARFGLDPVREAQVLAPMYRSPVGIDALNERLQKRLNPDGRPAFEGRFRVGDRLIQTRNAHELGLMNGSICFLTDDDPDEGELVVDTDEGESLVIPYDEAGSLRLAYAISVHKSQGSEIPAVVFVCHRSHARMLTRPLVYTAITRARRACVVVGDRAALAAAARRDDGGRRWSSLPRRLREPGLGHQATLS